MGGRDRMAHVTSLREGIAALPDATVAALNARGIGTLINELPDRAEQAQGPQDVRQLLDALGQIESGLTAAV